MDILSSSGTATLVAVAAAEAAPPAGHARPAACLNCDTPLTDRFCAHCGQAATTHRLTMGHLLHEIPHSIWHVDKGLFHTLRELLLRPAAALRGYLHGQRARHFPPLSLLLLVTGIASFIMLKMGVGKLVINPSFSTDMQQVQTRISETMMQYMSWIYVIMTPVAGVFVRRALRRTGINLAEAIVVAIYVTAASNFLSLLFTPAYYLVRTARTYLLVGMVSSLVLILYQSWAYAQLLASTSLGGFGRWWRGLLTAIATYLLVLVGAMTVGYGLNWGSFKAAFVKQVETERAKVRKAAPTPPARPVPATAPQ